MTFQKHLISFTLCLAIFTSGCAKVTIERPVELSKDAKDIAASMKMVDADKCALMYKQFAGLSDYMKNAGQKVDSTPKLFKMIDTFQTDYSYTKEGNKEYTDAVEKFLKDKGYMTPKKIVDVVKPEATNEVLRDQVVADMKTLADAAKAALESKNAKSK